MTRPLPSRATFSVPLAQALQKGGLWIHTVQLCVCTFFSHTWFPLLAVLCLYLFFSLLHRLLPLGGLFHCISRIVTQGFCFTYLKNLQMFLIHNIEPFITVSVHIPVLFGVFFCVFFVLLLMNAFYYLMLKMATSIYWVPVVWEALF